MAVSCGGSIAWLVVGARAAGADSVLGCACRPMRSLARGAGRRPPSALLRAVAVGAVLLGFFAISAVWSQVLVPAA